MAVYVLQRLGLGLATLWIVTIVVFLILRVAPGDAVIAALAQSPGEGSLTTEQIAARRAALGLDRSLAAQYVEWLGGLLRLQPGRSVATGRSVWEDAAPRFAVTLELAALTAVIIAAAGPALGVAAAAKRGGRIDFAVRAFALSGAAVPQFWLGLIIILALADFAGYFGAVDFTPFQSDPWRNIQQAGLPALVLAWRPSALLARVVRAASIDAFQLDFVRTARAKGLPERLVLLRHVLRNAMLPGLTVLGAQLVFLLSGVVVIEQVFNLPGLGRGLLVAVFARDYPTVQFLVVVFAALAILTNLAVDLAYARLDPRVRLRS